MLSGVGRNDPDAWQRFYERYKVLVFLRGRHYGLSETDTEELLSRVMGKFFQQREGCVQPILAYNPSLGRFRDYFCRIVNNLAMDMFRERKRLREVSTESEDGQSHDIADESGEASALREYRLCLLHEAFQVVKKELPVRQIQAFIAVRMDGVSPKRISRMQGTSLATVYNDVTAVTEALRRAVSLWESE